ncbi:fumarylacetoacetate hydrolase family protein [Modestobacter versicolor]|uniref:fumarylacetoacetate hydrolase family protein n=1 Tax=Modestobacter versicolor TaxID=429133 RepID=UPI0034E02962
MKLVTLRVDGANHVGALIDAGSAVLDLTAAAPEATAFTSMRHLISSGEAGLALADRVLDEHPISAVVPVEDAVLRAPLPDPVRMRDCTLFTAHLEPAFQALARQQAAAADDPAAEHERLIATGNYGLPPVLREQPVYYTCDHLAVSGPDDEIVAPPDSTRLDYELELGIVLGRTASDVSAEQAAELVFGWTIFNDWSLRDTQARVMQGNLGPGLGKDLPGGTTLGPCIVTRDEIGDPYALEMTARVNGVEWSRGNSSTITHRVEDALALFSRGRTLHAGEVLGSGTVLGGSGFEIGRQLKDGDVVELEVAGIGVLRNRVRYSNRD